MTGETAQVSSAPMKAPSCAVFLSYASEDAPAAQRIAEALRAAGIDVWFDQSELRGGDAWDRQIREKINECALFIPVISASAHARVGRRLPTQQARPVKLSEPVRNAFVGLRRVVYRHR